MLTLAEMPAQIQQVIRDRGLLDAPALESVPSAVLQQTIPQISALVMSGLSELANQPEGREQLWHLAKEAVATPPTVASSSNSGLIKSVLADRYHGTMHATATAAGLSVAAVAELLEVTTGAALVLLGGVVTEYGWSAAQLAQWLRPHQAERVLAPVLGGAPLAAGTTVEPTSWLAQRSNWLLLAVSVVAVAELGYILSTRSGDAEVVATSTAGNSAASENRSYTAIPVVSLTPKAAPATVPVPVVLKLKDGRRQVIGASSTESKLYQFLVDPSRGVDAADPTTNWIGFDRIYFDSNKATLTNESLWQLSNVASILKRFPDAKIKIGGYTDNTGQPLTNLRLSKARAQSALEALVSLGVPATRLTAVGYGELDNIATNDTEEGRAVNRRVSMQVVQK